MFLPGPKIHHELVILKTSKSISGRSLGFSARCRADRTGTERTIWKATLRINEFAYIQSRPPWLCRDYSALVGTTLMHFAEHLHAKFQSLSIILPSNN